MTNPRDRKSVLIVDDEVGIRDLMQRLFARRGLHLTIVTNVAEALAAIGSGRFDLLISDLSLPNGDGAKIVSAFRERFPRAPIILMSGAFPPEAQMRSLQALGVCATFAKPFNIRDIESAVFQALKIA
ncbi:MAG TPA: response regulator [Elusimicrobiota bacterium]|nr:response regulator [Elusimicrobiota bacterium]